MLLAGTQMHVITLIFVCIELVIFFYLIIYRLARPDDKKTYLNVILILLLITYNITGGLLPDPDLPGSVFTQEVIAYATGFITPCYFPYYVYKAFGLDKMKFHAFRGVFLFLMFPYFIFVITYAETNNLKIAKDLLVLPVLYATWVIWSLYKSIRYKYKNNVSSPERKEEVAVLFLSLTPWIGLPVIDYFDLGQAAEASITNTGFLLLLGLKVKQHVKQMRIEHQKLIDSELRLQDWNTKLQEEVDRKTRNLEKINEQRTNTLVNLAHETKTPLTLVTNYLDEYINKNGNSEELAVVKKSIDKLSNDILNLFDLERFNKGLSVYDHNLVANFSEIITDDLVLFNRYAAKRNIELRSTIEDNIFIKADPMAVTRIVNNLIENAIKFSNNGFIEVGLKSAGDKIILSIKDNGIGIAPELHKKIFEPYYQVANQKSSIQGMGLGLPIVQKIVHDLRGEIAIESDPKKSAGTKISLILNKHVLTENDAVSLNMGKLNVSLDGQGADIKENEYNEYKLTILVIEDNISMLTYLLKKLSENYNVYAALNGSDALKKIKSLPVVPDLIITDVMMDKLDGYTFVKIILNIPDYDHIPFIFLSAKSTLADKLYGLKLGAIDFMEKPFSIQELMQKTESILANVKRQKKALIKTAIASIGIKHASQSKNGEEIFEPNCKLYNLTSREKDITKLICEGYKYKEIGVKLFISERTVTTHAQNIFEKVSVSNKIELCKKIGMKN